MNEIPSDSKIRSPIGVIMGHVDSGKTSLLDKVRGTGVQAREEGGITQHVGASFFPIDTIAQVISKLTKGQINITIPGLLIVDTPGHAAFMNLRSRGASVADIAIVVVDIMRGFQAQTYESIDILRRRKTPFIVAANKIDRISSWKPNPGMDFPNTYNKQNKNAKQLLDDVIYTIMGELSEIGLLSERYDRVRDYTKNIAIIPTSAVTGEGIPDLFMILVGLAQQYLQERLHYTEGPGKGVVLEVKEESGLGTTLDVILFDGTIKATDTLVIGTREKPVEIKIRSLLQPKELDEMRDPRDRFIKVTEVHAAAGVKIAGAGINDVIAGVPILVSTSDEMTAQLKAEIEKDLQQIKIETQADGIILKTDTLGSLEALTEMLKERGVPIHSADIGNINKRDISEASIIREKTPQYGAILAFNVELTPEAEEDLFLQDVQLFQAGIVYRIIDEYDSWRLGEEERLQSDALADLIHPGKIQIMNGFVFRKNKPAIVGIEVLAGEIITNRGLLKENGERVGRIWQLRDKEESLQKARKGQQVACSIRGPTVGRQIKEGDILYLDIPKSHAKFFMTKHKDKITAAEKETLEEMQKIHQQRGRDFWPFA